MIRHRPYLTVTALRCMLLKTVRCLEEYTLKTKHMEFLAAVSSPMKTLLKLPLVSFTKNLDTRSTTRVSLKGQNRIYTSLDHLMRRPSKLNVLKGIAGLGLYSLSAISLMMLLSRQVGRLGCLISSLDPWLMLLLFSTTILQILVLLLASQF